MNETFISCHNIILFPFSDHLANPVWGVYLETQAELCDGSLTIEIHGTEEMKNAETMNGTGVLYKLFKTKLGYRGV